MHELLADINVIDNLDIDINLVNLVGLVNIFDDLLPVGRKSRDIINRFNERRYDILLNKIQTAPNIAQLNN